MSVLSGFYRAGYSIGGKTVRFYARRAEIAELGRRTVVHEYPNSDNRYVEDLGKIAGKYTLEIEIQETTASAYKRARNALMKALQTQGVGTLTHPTLGKKKVVPIPSSMTEDFIAENGIVYFNITFLESTLNIFPQSTQGNKGFLAGLYDKVFGENEGVFSDLVKYYDQGMEIFNQARDGIQEVTDTINDVVSTINGIADEVAAFSSDIKSLSGSIITLMQTPSNLAKRFTTIYNSIATITDDFKVMTDIVLQIFGSGDRTKVIGNSPLINQLNRTKVIGNSPLINQLNTNKIALGNFTDVACLNIAYLASTNIDYTSQSDIDTMLNRLNTAFNSLDPNSIDEDVYYTLQDIRTQNRLLLQNERATLPYYVSIRSNSIPTAVLSYNLYGTSSRVDELNALNGVEDPAFVSGNLIALSS